MPRPKKCRMVCNLPEINLFGPINSFINQNNNIIMSVDEYETIRLIDLEGLTQEECSNQMNIARTTVQSIYNDARKKVAKSLVNGDLLKIEGGNYKICEEPKNLCENGFYRHRCNKCFRK